MMPAGLIAQPALTSMEGKERAICAVLLIVISINGGWLEGVAADQTGFVSLDCGGSSSGDYASEEGLTWTTDTVAGGFGLEGVSGIGPVDSPQFNPPIRYNRIRYFEGNQSKYCYVFDGPGHGIQQKKAYLVRASFWLGAGELPFSTARNPDPSQIRFQLLINADVWDNISVTLPQTVPLVKEASVIAHLPTLSVCLSGRSLGLDTAFISSLEIRPLSDELDIPQRLTKAQNTSHALFLHSRLSFGSSPDDAVDIRYPDDIFDRIWKANTTEPRITASDQFNSSSAKKPNYPPDKVLQNALLSTTNNTPLVITLSDFTGAHAYYYTLFFFELSTKVIEHGQRAFNVTTSASPGNTFRSTTVDRIINERREIFNPSNDLLVGDGGLLELYMEPLATSTYGPYITALDLYLISDHEMSLGTNDIDVVAINTIRKGIDGLDGWSGDPCLPYAFDWLSCSNEIRPRVVSLVLSNKTMVGAIPSSISNLTSLIELDLRDNKLNGLIPEFLAKLPNLTTLNIQNNNFSGPIPIALLSKVKSSNLNLSIAGNPFLCGDLTNQSSCLAPPTPKTIETIPKKKSNAHLLGGILGGCGAFALIILGLCVYLRRSHAKKKDGINNDHEIMSHAQVAECSNQARAFTYREIQGISSMFATKLGEGSFGPVYYGNFNDGVNVALKVLQQGSTQGPQQFLNEVTLLSRVHHRNLAKLIGYCIQEKLVLVYEYMSNGSLHDCLVGSSKRTISWIQRLNIIVGSAEGLEYLHKGCNPAIIHRDVKSTNILLNDQMVAKISDFGISRASLYEYKEDAQPEMVTEVQGSYGYLDPEHFQTRQLNEKSDVYAFGVVLLEVVSGKPPIVQGKHHIVEWVRRFVEQGDINSIVDPTIANDNYNVSSMWKVVELAMSCVELEGRMRPDMSEVCSEVKLALSMQQKNQDSAASYSQTFNSYSLHAR